MAIFPSKLKAGPAKYTYIIYLMRRPTIALLDFVCVFFTEGPDCGYHIYRLIKGLSELDASLALAAPCPGVRNIRLISFRLQPEPRDQTPRGAMSVKSEQSLQFRHPADIIICVVE